jgi:bisphosphoglycerate-independent phosphoglycerate mutase (AlkP superfamily)
MSALELTSKIVPEIQNKTADFICLKYANADMVGHTGVWEAAKKAGYPDVVAYLTATGQVNKWCEEVPQKLVDVFLKAESCRRKISQTLSLNPGE